MTVLRWLAAICVVVLAGMLAPAADDKNKLPDAVMAALEKADKIDIYSLTGDQAEKGKPAWRGYESLGKATIQGDNLKAVVAAVKKGLAEGGDGARCFIPRHGIRVTQNGKIYDLVICFECRWVYVFEDDRRVAVVTISETSHQLLDKVLNDAGVKLAKPAK